MIWFYEPYLQLCNLGTIPSGMSTMSSLTQLSMSGNKLTGSIPSQLCSISALQFLDMTSSGPMNLTCSNWCLTTVTTRYIPSICLPGFQDAAVCGLTAALDITSDASYTMWQCNALGFALTNPCTGPWTGFACSGGYVASITLPASSLRGWYDLFIIFHYF